MITVINDVFAKKKKPLDSPDKLTHDWYSNDSWPIYHRQLTDIPPTVDWYTTDSWPIYHRHMTDSKSRCVVEISTDTRPIVYLTIDRLSTDYRPTIDRLSTDCRPTIDRYIDRVSTDYRPQNRPTDRSTLPTVNMIRLVYGRSSVQFPSGTQKFWVVLLSTHIISFIINIRSIKK